MLARLTRDTDKHFLMEIFIFFSSFHVLLNVNIDLICGIWGSPKVIIIQDNRLDLLQIILAPCHYDFVKQTISILHRIDSAVCIENVSPYCRWNLKKLEHASSDSTRQIKRINSV